MTDTPEIKRLREYAGETYSGQVVSLADAIQAVRDTEVRRTREIVEALRAADDGGDGYGSGDWAAVLIERTFLSPDNPEATA